MEHGREFPGNAHRPRRVEQPAAEEEKKIESVVSAAAIARKKSLGRRMRDMLIGGSTDSVMRFVIEDVIVPQARELLAEALTQGFERLIYGDNRGSSRRSSRPAAPTNYTRYSATSTSRPPQTRPPAVVRSKRIDDVLLATRFDAQRVLDEMMKTVEKYGAVTVADLYGLVEWSSTHTDGKWGWVELEETSIRRTRDGYLLELPEPDYLD